MTARWSRTSISHAHLATPSIPIFYPPHSPTPPASPPSYAFTF